MLGPGRSTVDKMVAVRQLKRNVAGRIKQKTPCSAEAARGFPFRELPYAGAIRSDVERGLIRKFIVRQASKPDASVSYPVPYPILSVLA